MAGALMSANPYMALLSRVQPPTPPYRRRRPPVPRGLMLILSKSLYQIEFKHYSEPKLLTAGE